MQSGPWTRTKYSYDALNRVSAVAYSLGSTTDQTISFTYDSGTNGKGHLTGGSDTNHSMSWGYDPLGRITSKSQTLGGVTLTVAYGYANADLTSETTPSGQSITYGYNANHQVTSVAVNGAPVLTGATYEPFGPINGWTWGNGTSSVRTFDADGNISLVNTGGDANSYAFDSASHISSITSATNNNLSWTYGYDTMDRLNAATSIPLQQTSTLDGDGNRLSQGGSYTDTFSGTLTYNDAGRLTAMQQNGSGQPITFVYNVLGQRVHKSSPTLGNTTFMYDEAGHLLGEYDDAGHLIEEMVWLGDVPVASLRPDGSGGVGVYYVHTDHLNTPRKISRPSDNALLWRWDPDAFGNGAPNQSPSGLGTFVSNVRFPGQYYDAETALVYNGARYYDPQTGRYIGSDPIGLAGGSLSSYAYANGNPISLRDPSGLLFGFGAGESYGDSAAQYWANLQTQTGNPLYAIPGVLASLWTPCTSNSTFLALAGGLGGRALSAAARLLPNGVKGLVGEGASIVSNWLRGSTFLGSQVSVPGLTTIADSAWIGTDGIGYYVESKFGTSGLTAAQRIAQNALGDLYHVERWGYDWVGRVGSAIGTAAGAGGAAAASNSCGCN